MKNLNQILTAEATEYEFKSELELKKPKSWLKTISAFANGLGGSVYFGVTDSGEVVGLADMQKASDQISELIKTRIEPPIQSARRNPVIADLFQRLDLAERRGSGIKKIRKEYENSDRQPVFFSNESWFTTTLYNLSYGIDYEMANGADPGNEVGDDGNKFGNGGNDNWDKIRNAITQNPRIKLDGICVETGISKRTVSRELKKMQEFGNVRRVGSARSGHWKIIDKP